MLQSYMDYCNLKVLSHYSLFKSIIKIPDLLSLCAKNNIKAIGICEEMNMFGFVEFSKNAQKYNIKPIFGCYLKIENYGLIPFFIKNRGGYEFLSYVLSQYYIKNSHFITLEEIVSQKGLICLIGGDKSNIPIEIIPQFQNIFKNDLFIDIQPNNYKFLEYAFQYNIPIVCTNSVNFLKPQDIDAFYAFQCIGDNKKYNQEDLDNSDFKNNYIHTLDTIKPLFNIDLTEGFQNSVIIAKKCNFILEQTEPIVPKYQEDGNTDENALLEKHSNQGLQERLLNIPKDLHQLYQDRLDIELKVLKDKNFSGYFLVTADFVKYAKSIGVPVGPARGSGAGSLVAYSMSITDIDPIKYDLIFERFLNPERNSMPDFDIDFCPERRKEVVDYLKSKYGTYNILQIMTFGTMQPKALIRDLCRIFNISFKESDFISRLIPQDQVNPIKLAQAIQLIPQLKKLTTTPKYEKMFKIAIELENLTRNFSKHAAGIVISDVPIWKICPIFRDDKDDLSVQFDLQDLEYVGGIKFDFLGLRTLTVLDYTFKLIHKKYGILLNFGNIPTDDEKTFELFRSGNLCGVFQFDGVGIQKIVMQLKPDNLEDLIVLNALYRPGPIGSIPVYIKRKHGQENVTYLHPLTENSLSKTYGVMVYQEQVMQIARDCAGYTHGEADLLRRAMGKKKPEEMKQQKDKFIQGALQKGISQNIADQLFALMNEFSGYGFNKSHSAPYALIAYICGYLKTHYPEEFICCFLSEEMSNTEKIIRFIQNAKFMKIPILPPCVFKSDDKFLIEYEEVKSIRYGLGALKNIGENAIENIITQRNRLQYADIYDFVARNITILNKKNWESLVKSGALDIFDISRESLLDSLQDIKYGKAIAKYEKEDYFSRLEKEKEIFGFFINNYAKNIQSTLRNLGCKKSEEFMSGNITSCFLVGEIASVKRKRVKDKSFYAFVEILEEANILYVTIFSTVLDQHSNKIKDGAFLVFDIKIEKKNNEIRLVAQNVFTLDEFLKRNSELRILLKNKEDMNKAFEIVQKSIEGNTGVYIYTDVNEYFIVEKFITDSIELRKELELSNLSLID